MVKRRKPSNEAAAPVRKQAPKPAAASTAAYSPALNAGFQATTSRVQEMHQAIAGRTFDHLLRVPGLSVPTRIVQGLHDAITQGVYAAVRHGGGAALALAGQAERLATDPQRVPGAREQTARSALNGVFGDSLRDAGSALAVQMGLHADGAPLALTPAALQGLHAHVCVFIHGLACDERSWALRNDTWQTSPWAAVLGDAQPPQYGALLARECGVSAAYLRYNTGLAIENNAEQLNDLMVLLAAAAPQVHQITLIGHSMGGLVARRAHALASAAGQAWAAATPMIVCLGSPHQGAPLEQAGQFAASALNAVDVTRPLGRLADARSRGIKDLRRGIAHQAPSSPALRMVFGRLGDEADAGFGTLIGKVLGDGLVMPASATDAGLPGDVERVELAGLGHMGLLNHPRVYAVLRRWLGAPELVSPAALRG
jgi:pimeloyl-ACP methyl ester carboxylesterase